MDKRTILKIGTRGSKLALAQSKMIGELIRKRHPGIDVELVIIKTKGDKIIDSPLSKIGGKGLFVKEIEEALLENRVDIAVHSIKDVPAELPHDLSIPFFPEREDPSDAFLSVKYERLNDLPEGSKVGTGSLRRSSQLLNKRPDIEIVPIRGNVDTRIKKLESGELDAILLAAAGLNRLGLSSKIKQLLSPLDFIPAVGQGALGLEVRTGDAECNKILEFLNHRETTLAVRAERAFLNRLEGGCQVPLGAHAFIEGDKIVIHGMVSELDGSRIIRDSLTGSCEQPEIAGETIAARLLSMGADKILAEIYGK
ncbi:MAG: hydroxymethylbilane synthase [Deltaproteobacteria bacterium]|nr:hydroxymethylbilane synthase [Deltaproteobacteria bacterium]